MRLIKGYPILRIGYFSNKVHSLLIMLISV